MKVEELMSIKDFSNFTGMKQDILRYYDDIGLFSPLARGDNNYRYYAPIQIITLNMIGVMRNLGIPLKQIHEMAEHRTPEKILNLFREQEIVLDAEMRRLQRSYSVIHNICQFLQDGKMADENSISVHEMPEQRLSLGQLNNFGSESMFYKAFVEACRDFTKRNINLNYTIGGLFDSFAEFCESPSLPNRFISMDPFGKDRKAAGEYMVAYTHGFYGDMGDVPQRMADYASEHSLKTKGALYAIYLHDEISVKDPDQYLAQVSVRVERIK
ncbi:MAG: MerR family transcriptional regulator [Oscillospiraceae bacterium]|jgi:DNA-binding transcriptional MerR regulator|nr:MerR family transcriptional regulator [Oscillospiraceae bacterium]